MTEQSDMTQTGNDGRLTLSVDAMGGDQGPAAVVAGCARFASTTPDVQFLLHGDQSQLAPLLAQAPSLHARATILHSPGVVQMDDKPAQIMRHGRETSMWGAVSSLRDGQAHACVSCGNTGALMAIAMLRLRKLPGVHRPAIACLWPARGNKGFNTMLDVGADIRADEESLLQFALMGAAYYRNAFGVALPRVGLLNVGTEDHKGRSEIREAARLISDAAELGRYTYLGFVEGNDIPSPDVDVIVTDGFTGNVALKTGEGTAKFMGDVLRQELTSGLLPKLGALLARGALGRMKTRLDPRLANGGVFLGLNGTVVKSHGSSDATGIAAALGLAYRLAQSGFLERMGERISAMTDSAQERVLQQAGNTEMGQSE
jgi:phosphate acyltransferase